MSGFIWRERVNDFAILTVGSIKNPQFAGFLYLGWLMGFEPTTTGITIQDSTAELQPPSVLITALNYSNLAC
jgi:hypothetical protein